MEKLQTAVLRRRRKSLKVLKKKAYLLGLLTKSSRYRSHAHSRLHSKPLIQTVCAKPSSEWSVLCWENLLKLGSIDRRRRSAEAEVQGVPHTSMGVCHVWRIQVSAVCRDSPIMKRMKMQSERLRENMLLLSAVLQSEVCSRWVSDLHAIICLQNIVLILSLLHGFVESKV